MYTNNMYSNVEPINTLFLHVHHDLKKKKRKISINNNRRQSHYKSDSLSLNCSYPGLSAYQISAGNGSQCNDALHVFIVSNYKITFSVHT